MNTLVPAYFHPVAQESAWRRLAARPPSTIILNIAGGPGTTRDPDFAHVLKPLHAAGVEVLGYIDTAYGARPVRELVADALRYRSWYGTSGTFLDQVSSGGDRLSHYRVATTALRPQGRLILNPGVYPDPDYTSLGDLLVTFEGPWTSYRSVRPPSWARNPASFCHLVHEVPAWARRFVERTASRLAGTGFLTTFRQPNPWGDLPSYYERIR
ncbi:spherulation-specific family 4 protein [Acrocarpospora catenulata]|uniref:spherulation-specific family 4 protein n=1 Tax=Acrocarpospora catenulata TaxID=2836182 RepID=UPI001BDAFE5B|nr:spherulation-specific family 4 protein [Acrocarpospora catenulata]